MNLMFATQGNSPCDQHWRQWIAKYVTSSVKQ